MNTLVRFTPAFASPLQSVDDLFAGLLRPASAGGRENAAPIRIEVKENANAYHVAATLPGVKKEEINVAVDGSTVTITAEIKREAEAKEGERVLHSERFYGKTSRAFSLDQEIDENQVEARYADGILSLVLPKKVPAAAKRITVH